MPLLGVPGAAQLPLVLCRPRAQLGVPGAAQLLLVLCRPRAQSVSNMPDLVVVMGEPNTFMKPSNSVLITLQNRIQKKSNSSTHCSNCLSTIAAYFINTD